MKDSEAKIPYLKLWSDICFYDVYKDCIDLEKYIIYLADKYKVSLIQIVAEMKRVTDIATERIKEHHKKQKDLDPIFMCECQEESIKTLIKYNREREEMKKETFDEALNAMNLINSINTRKVY